MAFDVQNLTLLQTAGDRASVFIYQEDAAVATIKAANYFDGALGIPAQLRDGDLIIISGNNGVELVKATVASGHVTVTGAPA